MILTDSDKRTMLTHFAAMLWQNGTLHAEDREALSVAAEQLGFGHDDPHVEWLGELPPFPEEVDPQSVPAWLGPTLYGFVALAASVRPSLARYEALELLEELLQLEAAVQLAA